SGGNKNLLYFKLGMTPGGLDKWSGWAMNAIRKTVEDFSPQGNLNRYLRHIRDFPFLPQDEEMALARRCRDEQDTEAGHHIVNCHLRLVASFARRFSGYGLPVEDLIAGGNMGLLEALRRFDPDRNIRFSAYAGWWIRAAIQVHVLNFWSVVKIGTTAAQKKLFFNLNRLKRDLNALDDGNLTPEQVGEIAARLKVSEKEVITMSLRLGGRDYSLNVTAGEEQDNEWIDLLVDDAEDQEEQLGEKQELDHERRLISEAMESLDKREKHIFAARRLEGERVIINDPWYKATNFETKRDGIATIVI
ncbi:MAG: RNA polymerase factor sigma-32, partial [Rhodospirillales bacterium]|nr:RNA polymerase factor sigma-32 [Rhodospirillales bacterium]